MIVTLPLPIADPSALPAGVDETSSRLRREGVGGILADPNAPKILVVDDHPINRLVLLRQVNALGYPAEDAANGVEALAKWDTGRFDIVVTDCNMPEMSGYELARAIRDREEQQRHSRTPIIACTANAMSGEVEKCYGAGMDDYLAKPITLAHLARVLERWRVVRGASPAIYKVDSTSK